MKMNKNLTLLKNVLTPEDVLSINEDISNSIGKPLELWEAEHLAYFLNKIIANKLKKEYNE